MKEVKKLETWLCKTDKLIGTTYDEEVVIVSTTLVSVSYKTKNGSCSYLLNMSKFLRLFIHVESNGVVTNFKTRIKDLECKLVETAQELGCMIDRENERLKLDTSSNDLDEPDYFDHQAVHDAMNLVKSNIAHYEKVVCRMCDGHGMIGNIFDSVDCPECVKDMNNDKARIVQLENAIKSMSYLGKIDMERVRDCYGLVCND